MEEMVAVMCVSKREGRRQREQEPITHRASSPIWSDRQSAEGKKQILVRHEVLLKQFPRTNSSGKPFPFVSWADRHSCQKDNLDLPYRSQERPHRGEDCINTAVSPAQGETLTVKVRWTRAGS